MLSRGVYRARAIALYRRCFWAARRCPRSEHGAQMKSYTKLKFADGSSQTHLGVDSLSLLLDDCEEQLGSMLYYLDIKSGVTLEDVRGRLKKEVQLATEAIVTASKAKYSKGTEHSASSPRGAKKDSTIALSETGVGGGASASKAAATPWSFCPSCGASFSAIPTAKFCASCGAARGGTSQ